jgi:hypothetical protein
MNFSTALLKDETRGDEIGFTSAARYSGVA